MQLPNDPAMLLSFVNLKLRDFYKSLDEMCDDMDADREDIERKLSKIGYEYDRSQNRFV
ncbi:MAG: DUF4250 domain-containing protein [Lachnospiraceae bacterium]|nr:DUF4250 domain-containing protein [Lachnospiraceae bacterium]MBQ8666148.1 DUF4250 domain-containing protein [Lachnospiraceae bacterium]MBR1450345.1 DUF4250 domain-containing protein [Lachnospiraceae bacterium]